jgi:hypothetical protein
MGIYIRFQTAVKKIEKLQFQSSLPLSSETFIDKYGSSNDNSKFLVYTSSVFNNVDDKNANIDQLTFQAIYGGSWRW